MKDASRSSNNSEASFLWAQRTSLQNFQPEVSILSDGSSIQAKKKKKEAIYYKLHIFCTNWKVWQLSLLQSLDWVL